MKWFLRVTAKWRSNLQLVHTDPFLPLVKISFPIPILYHYIQRPIPKPSEPWFKVSKRSNYSIPTVFPHLFRLKILHTASADTRKHCLIWATSFSSPANCFELNNQCCPSQLFPFQLINLNWPLSQQSFWLIFSLTTLSCRPVQHLRNVW